MAADESSLDLDVGPAAATTAAGGCVEVVLDRAGVLLDEEAVGAAGVLNSAGGV